MKKSEVYKEEYEKLQEAFKGVDPEKQKLVEGLILDASFLFAENWELRQLMDKTGGIIRVNPNNPAMQKETVAGKQYLKNINSYAVIIKSLNGILMKNTLEEEDAFDAWIKEKMKKNEEKQD